MLVKFKEEFGFDEGFPLEEVELEESELILNETASQEKIEEFQGILDDLITKYNLRKSSKISKELKVVFSPSSDFKNKKSWGEPIQESDGKNYWFSGIRLLDGAPEKRQLQAMYHEFRHIWQSVHYRKIYEWWLSKINKKFYDWFYFTNLCSIERDAYTFGISLGKKNQEKLFEKYDLKWLAENSIKMRNLIKKVEKSPKSNEEFQEILRKLKEE